MPIEIILCTIDKLLSTEEDEDFTDLFFHILMSYFLFGWRFLRWSGNIGERNLQLFFLGILGLIHQGGLFLNDSGLLDNVNLLDQRGNHVPDHLFFNFRLSFREDLLVFFYLF